MMISVQFYLYHYYFSKDKNKKQELETSTHIISYPQSGPERGEHMLGLRSRSPFSEYSVLHHGDGAAHNEEWSYIVN